MEGSKQLDLVFCCDCTGSMGSYIENAKRNITKIIEDIQASESAHVRFALVCYRDHPPQDRSYVTTVFDFTESVRKAKEYVSTMNASGGGDAPESVTCALEKVLNMPYRKKATKICVFVADAPCHGLYTKSYRDGFPKGCPDGHDPMQIANKLADMEVLIYSVGCEPALSNSPFCKDFFMALSLITGGRYVPLANAKALPAVIIGGAEEELQLDAMAEEINREEAAVRAELTKAGEALSDDEVYQRVTSNLQARGVEASTLTVDDIGEKDSSDVAEKIADFQTLVEVREYLEGLTPPSPHRGKPSARVATCSSRPEGSGAPSYDLGPSLCGAMPASMGMPPGAAPPSSAPSPTSYAMQAARNVSVPVSYAQVKRVQSRKKRSGAY